MLSSKLTNKAMGIILILLGFLLASAGIVLPALISTKIIPFSVIFILVLIYIIFAGFILNGSIRKLIKLLRDNKS